VSEAYPTNLFRPSSIADVAARDYDDDSERAASLARDLRECGWESMADEFSRLGFVAFIAARAERLSVPCEPS
jgi:hypothetical protein